MFIHNAKCLYLAVTLEWKIPLAVPHLVIRNKYFKLLKVLYFQSWKSIDMYFRHCNLSVQLFSQWIKYQKTCFLSTFQIWIRNNIYYRRLSTHGMYLQKFQHKKNIVISIIGTNFDIFVISSHLLGLAPKYWP